MEQTINSEKLGALENRFLQVNVFGFERTMVVKSIGKKVLLVERAGKGIIRSVEIDGRGCWVSCGRIIADNYESWLTTPNMPEYEKLNSYLESVGK